MWRRFAHWNGNLNLLYQIENSLQQMMTNGHAINFSHLSAYISQTRNKFLMKVKLKNLNFYSTLLPTGELFDESQRRTQKDSFTNTFVNTRTIHIRTIRVRIKLAREILTVLICYGQCFENTENFQFYGSQFPDMKIKHNIY